MKNCIINQKETILIIYSSELADDASIFINIFEVQELFLLEIHLIPYLTKLRSS